MGNIRMLLQRTALILMLFSSPVAADLIWGGYYSPGYKIGIQFGKKTEFVMGFENSVVIAFLYGMPYAGVVGGIEFNFSQKKFIEYWEVEAGFTPVGVAFGGEWNQGYHSSIRIFGGALGYLSYKHLFRTKINEIGLTAKIPISVYQVMDHGIYLFGKEIKSYE